MTRELELPPSFLLEGVRGSGKTSILLELHEAVPDSVYIDCCTEKVTAEGLLAMDAPCYMLDSVSFLEEREKIFSILLSSGKRIVAASDKALESDLQAVPLLPLSFREFLTARGIPSDPVSLWGLSSRNAVQSAFGAYLFSGGIRAGCGPAIDPGVRKADSYLAMLSHLAMSLGRGCSLPELRRASGLSKETVRKYLRTAIDSFIVFPVRSLRTEKVLFYFTDNSLLSLFPVKTGMLLENLVAVALLRRHGSGFRCVKRHGIDFLTETGTAIRVKEELDRFSRAKDRAAKPFSALPEAKEFLVLTALEDADMLIRNVRVEARPCWKWLLD